MQIKEKESSTLEFKESFPSNDKLLRTIVAFCNLYGGKLLIGVRNDGSVKGLRETEIQEKLEFLNKLIFESCTPPILPHIYARRFGEKMVLVIEVAEGMSKPYFIATQGVQDGTYIRLGRSTQRANHLLIQELQWKSRGRSADEIPVFHASERDLDESAIISFLRARKPRKQGFSGKAKDACGAYKLLIEDQGRAYPTTAGILLFGKEPQKTFPEAFIICSHFKGNEGRDTIATIDATGSLFHQLDTAFDFILSCIPKSFEIRGKKRTETHQVPQEAIREILINAIVHRDYQMPSPIKIAIYSNRIEIFSPGIFPGPIQPQNLEQGLTFIRNIYICKVFREAGYVEKLGSGFPTVFESYRKQNLATPQIIEGDGYVKCILPRTKKVFKATKEEDVIGLVESMNEISISDVIKHLYVARATAGRILKSLIKKQRLERHGKGPNARYRVKTPLE